jgi:hypothetical protein
MDLDLRRDLPSLSRRLEDTTGGTSRKIMAKSRARGLDGGWGTMGKGERLREGVKAPLPP